MNCEELVRYLSDYIDDNLSPELRAEAEAHLATCQNCHIVLDTTRKTILLYKEAGKQEISLDHKVEIFNRLQNIFSQRKDCPPEI